MGNAVKELREHLAEIHDIGKAIGVLGWDQQTYMPARGGPHRAEQISTLSRLAHAKFTSDRTATLLDAAEPEVASLPEEHDDRCLVRIVRRDYDRARKLPEAFVAAWARDRVLSNQVWRQARPANDFAAFRPHLEKMVDYARRAADFYGYEDHPYDALLEGYEPGMRTADVRRIFDAIRPEQVALVRAIVERPEPRTDFLHRDYSVEAQAGFGLRIAQDYGYDLTRGRLDTSPHPFATSFGRDDVRITSRYDRNGLSEGLFAILHETGHALYEMNTAASLGRTPLARGCSMVFHESSSRMWENVVGRSRPLWEHYFPQLRQTFPDALGDVTVEEFYRAINKVQPSLIRVVADEVTYNLHIMLRFDLELELVTDKMRAADLPEAWAAGMRSYLGITPPDDRDGVMQDSHWSSGSFGYFPTYALGNVLSAQIYQTALAARPEIPSEIREGRFQTLREWLVDNVYRHGRKFLPHELVQRVTGRPLEPQPYLLYLKAKYSQIYGL
ncbi:MAG: carboxypeptidase M32 [Armatimonadota bacterium]|nr:carboxypeptidase M32 [Armatimonadota bacterium]